MQDDVLDALADLARAFASARVRWYVFGAQAVVAAGVPRLTSDIDVTVEAPRAGIKALVAALERRGFALRPVGDVATFIAETRVIPVDHIASSMPVDVVVAGPGLEEEMMARVRLRDVGGQQIPFIDTADLIALKLLAGRPKDLDDVRGLLRARSSELSVGVVRERVAGLGSMIDSTLAQTFDRLVKEESEPAPKAKKPTTRAKGRGGRASSTPRRR